MKALRIQGLAFSLGALLLATATLALGRFDERIELIVVAVLIVVLGLPHGALDTLFAHRLYGINTLGGWLRFGGIYLLLSALVVGLWLLQPALFLGGFLVISAAHFSGDPGAGTPSPARTLYGGAIIILPALLHAEDMARLFGLLAGAQPAAILVPWLSLMAWPWLAGLALVLLQRFRADWLTALEMGAVGALATIAPPLVAFVVFFCGMHSARHILRSMDYSGRSSLRRLLAAAFLPMLGVLAGSAVAWYFLKETSLDARIVQLVFVGLAALTVPHMVLVEQVRLSDWKKGAAPRP
jgi:Brp/Blh family beta-carotene 15,15'-monooxygenase